jgi:hypothetical protein
MNTSFFEQRHILLVLQQRAHQRRHATLSSLLCSASTGCLGHQQLQPVEQLGRSTASSSGPGRLRTS